MFLFAYFSCKHTLIDKNILLTFITIFQKKIHSHHIIALVWTKHTTQVSGMTISVCDSIWITNKNSEREFLAPPNRKAMGQSGLLMIFCIQTMKWMKLKTERDLSYIDPLTVEFFKNNETSSISVILLTNGLKEGQTDRQTVMILIPPWRR